jgi:hypothetical protein
MTTITIPPSSLDVGTHAFTGAIDDVDNRVAITLDRTVAGGLNSLTADSTLAISIGQSDDGGATFYESAGTGLPGWSGGTVADPHTGSPMLANHQGTSFEPGIGRIARLTVIIGGPSPVVVAGTIVTSS